MKEIADSKLSRRSFLGAAAALGAVSIGLAAGCSAVEAPGGNTGKNTTETELETDVLVIGSGLAGMTAALKVQELGAKVLIIDKADALGTGANSSISSGMFCSPLDDSEESRSKLYDLFMVKCKGEGNPEITKLIVDGVNKGMDWLRDRGAEFTEATIAPTNDYQQCFAAPGPSQGMSPMLQALASSYNDAGGESLCGAKVLDFIFDDKGAVAGVSVRTADGIKTVKSKVTINAAGGYVANRQILETFVGKDGDEVSLRGFTTITGDVMLASVRAGGMLYQMGGLDSLHIGAVSPTNPAGGNPYLALPFTLAINSEGERYTDESLGYVNNGKAVMDQPGQVCALVFDETIAEQPNVKTDFDKFVTMGCPIIEADSLTSLAEQIDVPAAAFEATVAAFNAASDGDKTSSLAVNKRQFAMKLQGPKYYAFYPLKPGSILAFGGLYCNENMQILEADGTPIENLFLAGECVGGVYKYDYQGGASLARCVSTGIAAAERAVAKISQ